MILKTNEGISIAAILSVLACLTFLAGFFYGKASATPEGRKTLMPPATRYERILKAKGQEGL